MLSIARSALRPMLHAAVLPLTAIAAPGACGLPRLLQIQQRPYSQQTAPSMRQKRSGGGGRETVSTIRGRSIPQPAPCRDIDFMLPAWRPTPSPPAQCHRLDISSSPESTACRRTLSPHGRQYSKCQAGPVTACWAVVTPGQPECCVFASSL